MLAETGPRSPQPPKEHPILEYAVLVLSVGAAIFMVLAGLAITWG